MLMVAGFSVPCGSAGISVGQIGNSHFREAPLKQSGGGKVTVTFRL